MSDEDKIFGGSLVLDFRKWWRHVKTIYIPSLKTMHSNKDKVIANLHTSLYKGVEAIAQEVKTRDEGNLMSIVRTRPFLFTNPKIQPAGTTRCHPLKTKGKNTTR